jgi:hypothetical protein
MPYRIARYCTRERHPTVDTVGGSFGRAEQITTWTPNCRHAIDGLSPEWSRDFGQVSTAISFGPKSAFI